MFRPKAVYVVMGLVFAAVLSCFAAVSAHAADKEITLQKKAQVYIIHGYMASPADHWFLWLKQQLAQDGANVQILSMPNSSKPDAQEWDHYLRQHIAAPDENTYFVAHSLGSIALLRYLAGLNGTDKIGGVVLVAGFLEPLPSLPELDGFTKTVPDLAAVVEMSPSRAVILSNDDTIVPPVFTENLAKALDVNPVKLDKGGHFLGSDGFNEFPLVYEILTGFMN